MVHVTWSSTLYFADNVSAKSIAHWKAHEFAASTNITIVSPSLSPLLLHVVILSLCASNYSLYLSQSFVHKSKNHILKRQSLFNPPDAVTNMCALCDGFWQKATGDTGRSSCA